MTNQVRSQLKETPKLVKYFKLGGLGDVEGIKRFVSHSKPNWPNVTVDFKDDELGT